MAMMRAVVLDDRGVGFRRVPIPELRHPDDVRVRVSVAGLCRTDLLVAAGKLPVATPRVLGHEFSGTVEAVGPAAAGVKPGDRVAVNPVFGCGRCPVCAADPINCPRRTMLGLDRDGAFAEFVVVPAANVFPVPPHVPELAAAYAEPVAAALAVFNAGLDPSEYGLVHGNNRFARLVELVLCDAGFGTLSRVDPAVALDDEFDFAVETGLDGPTFDDLVRVIRPGGTLVVKSRQAVRVGVDFAAAVRKQLTIRAVNYGPFRRAVGLLAEGRLNLTGLFGATYPLERWHEAFAAAGNEAAKVFLTTATEG
ncbi:zinc-dependent alcohol dehydrogenase [Limnoglobus roseus]|uniref:L-iditol 2-dehydrogenase n=1 Tax=Limnoglobus roseus TaxID=2598579 RepID=A0A5C1ACB0_9BACT|nr:alcohol dehydrogenase catalytic domain-containing protein [Limnoglobus roseus]QEL14668.1 L-iditol 2-dehydrogenase [Limnoglobus roseus]